MSKLGNHQRNCARTLLGAAALAIVTLTMGSVPASADDFASRNNQGNKLVKEGKLDEALQTYQETAVEHPGEPVLDYNMANVYHMKGVFDTAATEYQDALASTTLPVTPETYYNLGNTLFRMGQYGPAAEAYKKSLIENPADREAKFNLELALKRLESDSTQKEKKDQKDQNKPDSTQQEQQDQQQNDQNKSDSTQQNQDQNQQQKQDSSDAQQQPQNSQDQQQQEQAGQQQPPPQPVGMTKEDAQRILDALKDNELDVQKQRAQRMQVPATAKDW